MGRTNVVLPLNAAVQAAAAASHGWNFVGGIANQFLDHGYAADDNWVVQILESFGSQKDKDGSFHPNGKGQAVYAAQIYQQLAAALGISGGSPNWLGFAASAAQTLTIANATSLASADVDGDNDADLVVGTSDAGAKLYLNAGISATGAWLLFGTTATTVGSATANVTDVELGDVNADARPDLVIATASAVTVHRNQGPTSGGWAGFTTSADATTPSGGVAVALGDVNGDGFADLVVASTASKLFLNNKNNTTTGAWLGLNTGAPVALGTTNANSVAIADVDGDGVVDIVLGVGSGDPSQLYVNRGVAGGTWAGLRIPVAIGTTGATTALAIGDLDGDGDADLLLARNGTANLLFRGEPTKLTRVAFSELSGTLGPVSFEDGEGAFVLLGGAGGGLAGTFSGKASIGSGGGFSAGVSLAVRFNSSTRAVDETIDVGGVRIDVRFNACEVADAASPPCTTAVTGSFYEISGSAVIRLGDFVEIYLSGTFGNGASTGTGSIFIGQGPGFLDAAGTIRNPSARGLFVTNVTFELFKCATATTTGCTAAGQRAVSASGQISVSGIPGISISGLVRVKFNETSQDRFTGDDLVVAAGTSPTQVFTADDLTFEVGGFRFNGELDVAKNGTDITLSLTNVTLKLGDAPEPVVVTLTTGTFTLSSQGVYGGATGTVVLNLDGTPLASVSATVLVNRTSATKTILAESVAGNSLLVRATLTNVGLLGQSLSATLELEQVAGQVSPQAPPGTPAPSIVRIKVTNLTLFLGDQAANAGVQVTNGNGYLVRTAAGLAGRISLTLTVKTGAASTLNFTGQFSLAVNTTTAAFSDQFVVGGQSVTLSLPAGPYLRIEGSGARVHVPGPGHPRRLRVREGDLRRDADRPGARAERQRVVRQRRHELRHRCERHGRARPARQAASAASSAAT